ncbi:MAG: thioredoxin domain-containing protein [Myxococcota bacterium]
MLRSVWSTALLSFSRPPLSLALGPTLGLALGLTLAAAPGCIGKRRPAAGQEAKAKASTPTAPVALVQPEDVDDRFDVLVEGERVRVRYDERDPAMGAAEPLVTIVEFSDFQCPFCSRLADTLHDVAREYRDEVKLVFKQLPLPMHANAEPAARAALAAHQQGKFWELHDTLFANQKALGDAQLATYASAAGVDMNRWRKDFQSDAIKTHVADDKALATTLQIRSTPTFYVNGKFFKGAQQPEQVRAIIDQELLAARTLLQAGAARGELYARFLHAAPELPGWKPKAKEPGKPAEPATPDTPAAEPAAEPAADLDADHVPGQPSRVTNYAVPIGQGRPSRGPADALVTIVEFGAFDCDECRAVQPALDKLLKKYPKDVRLVFRQLAEEIPPRRMAQLALAAHAQGKFWAAHDELMAMEGEFDPETAKTFPQTLGLDETKFSADLRDRSEGGPIDLIQKDVAAAKVFQGSTPAPAFYVNGRFISGNASFEELDKLVVEEKAKAEAFLADKKVPRAKLYEAMRATWRGYDRAQAP